RIVRKVRGGVTVRPSVVFESDFAYRAQIQLVEKRALARRAASLIEPGAAIVLDDSTTVGELVPHLRAIRPLTVITNARDVINALAGLDEISLIALGGHFDPRTNAFFGALGEGALTQLRADLAFLSTRAVKGHCAYLHDEDVLGLKQAMMRVAEQRI